MQKRTGKEQGKKRSRRIRTRTRMSRRIRNRRNINRNRRIRRKIRRIGRKTRRIRIRRKKQVLHKKLRQAANKSPFLVKRCRTARF